MKVAVLDHGRGNLRSVARALEEAGTSAAITSDPADLASADALCVPGQGIFDRCMDDLNSSGLAGAIVAWVGEERPYLGICLGLQVLFEASEEGEHVPGLGLLRGEVRRLQGKVPVPHIGWNTVGPEHYYFDHSFAAFPEDDSIVKGWCRHGPRFAAWVETGSVTGVQFHPEKSGRAGIELLRRWVTSV